MSTIKYLYAREILDGRGVPTVECSLWLDDGRSVTSSAPSGTSKSKYEAIELRDSDPQRMNGLGVWRAVNNVNQVIAPQLLGQDPENQETIDQLMINLDGTHNKSNLGSNAILAVSQAVLKAAALAHNLPLHQYIAQKFAFAGNSNIPTAIYTMIAGGTHGAANLDIQEFEIIPAGHHDFATSLNIAVSVFQKLREVLILKGAIHSTGVSGGFTPNLFNNTDAFEILIETIKATNYTFAQDVFLGTDIAAAQFHEGGKYVLKDKSQAYSSQDLIEYYKQLKELYHVFYIEDPFEEDDWKAWSALTAEIGGTSLIVGDSLLASNLEKLNKAIAEKACNAILIKPNQNGSISETLKVVKAAQEANFQVIVSHRSGDTNDDFIADFAVGVNANYMKFGPPHRGERVAKYNRLLAIAQEIQYARQSNKST